MSEKIFTYFDASKGFEYQGDIFYHWYHSWKRRGWEPKLLTPRTIVTHPLRKRLQSMLKEMYPENPVEQMRRMAILAMHAVGADFYYSDYDVINYDLVDPPFPRSEFIYACQGFGFFGACGVERVLDLILEGSEVSFEPVMLKFCGYPGDDRLPLIHFSRAACNGTLKHDAVETYHRRY